MPHEDITDARAEALDDELFNAEETRQLGADETDFDCTGTWDGCSVGSDADPGL